MDGPVETTGDLVSLTAVAVAAGRAVESSRPDGLIHDPFAGPIVEALLADSSREIDLPVEWPEAFDDLTPRDRRLLFASVFVGLRTRFVDDYLAGLQPGADPLPEVDLPRQVVILGAGLDTRAFRLDWPGRTEIFELDRTEVLLYKREVLRAMGAGPRCEWFAVPTDFGPSWDYALIAAGFDRRRRTAWIVEGLLPYLLPDAQAGVIATIARLSVPGSRAVVEHAAPVGESPELVDRLRTFAAETGLPIDGLLARANPPDPGRLLAERGWSVQEHTITELAERYGRSLAADAVPGEPGEGSALAAEDTTPAARGFSTAQLGDVVG